MMYIDSDYLFQWNNDISALILILFLDIVAL